MVLTVQTLWWSRASAISVRTELNTLIIYWSKEQYADVRVAYSRDITARLAERFGEFHRASKAIAERMDDLSARFKAQAELLSSRRVDVEAQKRELYIRGQVQIKAVAAVCFAVRPVMLLLSVGSSNKQSSALEKLLDKLQEEMAKEIQGTLLRPPNLGPLVFVSFLTRLLDMSQLAELYELLASAYSSEADRLRSQAQKWQDVAATVAGINSQGGQRRRGDT